MSLFSAITTAISGLTAQSTSFGNISEDVANSQTIGFKRVDTSFVDYLTQSTPTQNEPGSVVATPDYVNNVQGTVTQSSNTLAMAITGQGFFAVSQAVSNVNNVPTFNPQQYYTRAGDFTMNAAGYLVNSAGNYLNGWSVNSATGAVNQNVLAPIQVTQSSYNPSATTSVTLAANLPATPAANTATAASPLSSPITVYDSLGTGHIVNLQWSQALDGSGNVLPDQWNVTANVPDAGASADAGSALVTFGSDGTISSIASPVNSDPTDISVAGQSNTAGQPASLSFTTSFGGTNSQTISVNLGNYGGTNGITQFAGTTYALLGLTQNGIPPGQYSSVTAQTNGDVVVNYDNGQSRTIAQVPIVTFNAPNALQGQNGQSYTATVNSGTPLANAANSNGAGKLVTGATEGSNVDIATEFSNLIVAQQAYSANSKVVTTANSMLQTALQMVA
jgi:flagellar hook protein FlgE